MDIEQLSGSTLAGMADAVEKSSVVLVCMSEKYKESSNCRSGNDVSYFRLKKYIFGVAHNPYSNS